MNEVTVHGRIFGGATSVQLVSNFYLDDSQAGEAQATPEMPEWVLTLSGVGLITIGLAGRRGARTAVIAASTM